MARKGGIIVCWVDNDIDKHHGIVYYAEQTPVFQNKGTVLITLTDEDHEPRKDSKGHTIKVVKHANKLQTIGYVD